MNSAWSGSGIVGLMDAVDRVEKKIAAKPAFEGTVLRVLSVDPGKVTGVSVFWAKRRNIVARGGELRAGAGDWRPIAWAETLLAHNENKQVADVLAVAEKLVEKGPIDVVIENFVVRQISMEKTFLSPVRIGSKIEWGLMDRSEPWLHGVAIQWVEPSEMAAMRDDRLKALGHYTPGPDHRRDATRHALLHLRGVSAKGGKRNSVSEIIEKKPPVWGSVHGGGRVVGRVRLLAER